jgi:hypothetical protein
MKMLDLQNEISRYLVVDLVPALIQYFEQSAWERLRPHHYDDRFWTILMSFERFLYESAVLWNNTSWDLQTLEQLGNKLSQVEEILAFCVPMKPRLEEFLETQELLSDPWYNYEDLLSEVISGSWEDDPNPMFEIINDEEDPGFESWVEREIDFDSPDDRLCGTMMLSNQRPFSPEDLPDFRSNLPVSIRREVQDDIVLYLRRINQEMIDEVNRFLRLRFLATGDKTVTHPMGYPADQALMYYDDVLGYARIHPHMERCLQIRPPVANSTVRYPQISYKLDFAFKVFNVQNKL